MLFVCQVMSFRRQLGNRIFTSACAHSVYFSEDSLKSMSTNRSERRTQRDRSIPRRPLLWLAAALLFTLPPMFGSLATWVPSLFLLALAMKFWMEPKGYRLRFATLKLVLAAVTLAAIFFS